MSESENDSASQQAPPPADETVPSDARMMAMLCHISALAGYAIPLGNIIGPLIFWLIKKDEMPFVDEQGKESINFQITMTIAMIISGVLILALVGIILLPAVIITSLILMIIASIKANAGEHYRYPLTIRFIS